MIAGGWVNVQGWPGEGCLCKSNVRGVEDAGSSDFPAGRSTEPGAQAPAESCCGLGRGHAGHGGDVRGAGGCGEEGWTLDATVA